MALYKLLITMFIQMLNNLQAVLNFSRSVQKLCHAYILYIIQSDAVDSTSINPIRFRTITLFSSKNILQIKLFWRADRITCML